MTCLSTHREKTEVELPTIRNPTLGGGWSASRPDRFIRRKDSVPLVQ